MENEFGRFEEAGLKIDQDRVLTYSHLSCPLDCKYCFVDDLNFNQQKNVAYLDSSQLELIHQLPENIKLIMLGCDTEFFQNQNEAIGILEALTTTHKNLSIVTKFALQEGIINQLKQINDKLSDSSNHLTLSVSLTCMESAPKWEPRVPTPQMRIETLRRAYLSGIKTLVALRPLLPDISKEELSSIIDKTSEYCYGYYSGPLYLKDINNGLIDMREANELKIEKLQPHWMPQGNEFYKVEKIGQMEMLIDLIKSHNKEVFDGAADAIENINYDEKH